MASDPAFLFYPGDYLRDTQTLSEQSQVAYDRIMCEHMRNICISKTQLNFFIKRLTNEQKEELMYTLTKVQGGFQIKWVAESIAKRRKYSESRRKNRISKGSKNSKDMINISNSYDKHMENENEIENKNVNTDEFCKLFNINEQMNFSAFRDVDNYLNVNDSDFILTQARNYCSQAKGNYRKSWRKFLIGDKFNPPLWQDQIFEAKQQESKWK